MSGTSQNAHRQESEGATASSAGNVHNETESNIERDTAEWQKFNILGLGCSSCTLGMCSR